MKNYLNTNTPLDWLKYYCNFIFNSLFLDFLKFEVKTIRDITTDFQHTDPESTVKDDSTRQQE